jgi:MoaA/NifB/PqqE/SkfB family radical SAM enzyme
MAFEIFKKALDDYISMGGRKISLTPTIGEPLIDPGVLEKINYAFGTSKIKKIYLYTNGILLNSNHLYKKIIDAGINEIGISCPGFEKKLFKDIYGVDKYDEFLSGVISLLEYNRAQKDPVEISFNFRSPYLPSRVLKSPDFLKYIKPFLSKKVKCSFLVDYDNWGGSISQKDLKGIMKLRRPFLVYRTPCLRMQEASILFDGGVRLCGCRFKETEFDELVVGNVMEEPLDKIFFGDKALKIRKSFLDNSPPAVCQNCSLYDPGNFQYPNFIR